MNEPMQAIPEQGYKTQAEKIDIILEAIAQSNPGRIERVAYNDEVKALKDYINLLRRQAAKAKNQRKALKNLNRAHRAIIMENRWLRETGLVMFNSQGMMEVLARAKNTLWSMFKTEMNQKR